MPDPAPDPVPDPTPDPDPDPGPEPPPQPDPEPDPTPGVLPYRAGPGAILPLLDRTVATDAPCPVYRWTEGAWGTEPTTETVGEGWYVVPPQPWPGWGLGEGPDRPVPEGWFLVPPSYDQLPEMAGPTSPLPGGFEMVEPRFPW